MNLEVFREQDTVFIRDVDSPTLNEWLLPVEVWAAVVMRGDFTYTTSEDQPIVDGPPPVWGQTPPAADEAVFARDNPDRRG